MGFDLAVLTAIVVLAAVLTVALTLVLMPALKAHVVARPNSRSSHTEPTPQGGGAAVVTAIFLVAWTAIALVGGVAQDDIIRLVVLTVAGALLALLGAIDDVRGLAPLPRLAVQAIAVGLVVASAPDGATVPFVPWWMERILIFLGGLWFVNLVNFMDGVDWMTVAEVVPVASAILLIGWMEMLTPLLLIVSATLLGAMIGFAPFNKPVARLFLGDVGSLPIGLILGWMLLLLAAQGHLAAAILLPLYYLADATLTLCIRLWRGEHVWQAHRTHFYQLALEGSLDCSGVVGRVFMTNLALAALAVVCVRANNVLISGASLVVGAGLVALLLARFSGSGKPQH